MKVKICGIRTREAAVNAAEAGADFLGFNFAPVSKRRVAPAVARTAIASCQAVFGDTEMVGVFVNQPLDEVAQIASDLGLHYIQLSGDEDPAYCLEVVKRAATPVIKAVRLGRPSEAAQIEVFGGVSDFLLADTTAEGSYGGSGQPWRWRDAAELTSRFSVLLAGGLTAGNVAEAVDAARPWGVDVASGVEIDGMTNSEKVRVFIRRAKGTNDQDHDDNRRDNR